MSKIIMGVYKLTNMVNGKVYIGSALDIYARWALHKKPYSKQVISKALRKYGVDNFSWEILEAIDDREFLLEREQYYLNFYEPFVHNGQGYNVRMVANSNLGIKMSAEARRKMSEYRKGRKFSEDHKQHMREAWYLNRSDEYFAQLSDRMKGNNNPTKRDEVREKLSKSHVGLTWNDDVERLEKHTTRSSQMMKELHNDPLFKEKLREAHCGAKRSDTAKANMSAWQQRCYVITAPDGEQHEVFSRDLKNFCKDNDLTYACLQQCSKNGKKHKGWLCECREE